MTEVADTRIVYGARCLWWDSIDKVGRTGLFTYSIGPASLRTSPGLPCCPHCKGLLFEMPDMNAWMAGVPAHEAKHPGYTEMLKWSRGRCFKTAAEQKAAYKAETGIEVP